MKSELEESALKLEVAQVTALSNSPLPESLENLYQERQPKGYDAVLHDFLKLSKRFVRVQWGLATCLFMMLPVLFYSPVRLQLHALILFSLIPLVLLAVQMSFPRKLKEQILFLSKYGDPSLIGLCCEMLGSRDRGFDRDVAAILERLLPKFKASEATLLKEEHRSKLREALAPNFMRDESIDDSAFQVSILRAFEQVGGEMELPVVSSIAHAERDDYPANVLEAAKVCLPYLRNRVEHDQASQTLLRPSSLAEFIDPLLLRSVTNPGNTNPRELLRSRSVVENQEVTKVVKTE